MAGEQFSFPRIPSVSAGYASASPFGIEMPPGGRVAAFVRSTGPQSNDDRQIASLLVPTLAAGLLRCRAGQYDTVFVLPGHVEAGVGTTMLANLVASTKIIGIGQGASMPRFDWTATTDNWALSVNDVTISGLRLRFDQANGVTSAITWTGADCLLTNCDIEMSASASLVATAGITVSGSTGSRGQIIGNVFRGVPLGLCTNGILVSGTPDQFVIGSNKMFFASDVNNGLINISGAATEIWVALNALHNSKAASIATIAVADVASTGLLSDNYSIVENNGVAANQGIVFAGVTTTKIKCNQNFTSDEPGKDGVLAPGAVAT